MVGRSSAIASSADSDESGFADADVLSGAAVEVDPHDLVQVRVRDPQHARRERKPARLVEAVVDAQL